MTRSWRGISVMPTLGVDDLDQACRFYESLGFEEQWRYPDDGAAINIGLRMNDISFMLMQTPEPTARQNLYIFIENVRAFHEHLSMVLSDLGPLIEADYGMLDFSITDPWGHLLTFGEAQESVHGGK